MLDWHEMLEEYIIDMKLKGFSNHTVKTYNSVLKRFIEILDKENVENKEEFIRLFKKYLYKRMEEVCKNYMALQVYVWRAFLQSHDLDWLDDFKAPKREKKLPEVLNDVEVAQLIEYLESLPKGKGNLKKRAMVNLFLSTGVRCSELTNMKLGDVDFDNKRIKVYGKGAKERIVLFDDYTLKCLVEYIDVVKPEEYLFEGRGGKTMSSRTVQLYVKSLGKAAKLGKSLHPHIFRHTFATSLLITNH